MMCALLYNIMYKLYVQSAITCAALGPLTDGSIVYSGDVDSTAPYDINSLATHSCNIGFSLQGSNSRTCTIDNTSPTGGVFDGSIPTCVGKFGSILFYTILIVDEV